MINIVRAHSRGWAYEKAMSLRQAFAVHDFPTDDDLQRVLDGLGIDLVEEELPGELIEMFSEGVLVVDPSTSRARRRWAIAHAIGHHLGHSGDQTRLGPEWRWRQERQADVFAGFLLLGSPWLERARSAYEVAESADVPMERVIQWLGWLAC